MDFSLSKEQQDIKKAAAEFAKGEFKPEVAHECELNHRFPRELYKKAGGLGFVGMDYPEEVGGGGMGVLENVLIVEEFCKADSGIGMAIHLAYLPAKIVRIFGTAEQRRKYLTPITRGDWICGVCFTEPDHGSDLTRMETTLVEKSDGFVLNGTKIFTTNAAYADYFIVLAQDDPDAAPGKGMTTVLVEKDPSSRLSGSLEINEIPHKMGIRTTSSGELVFHELKVPKKNIVGERGKGLNTVLGFLDESRIEIAAQALGNAEGAFLKALNHARERRQFQKPIIDFQAIGHRLGRLWSQLMSVKYLTYFAAWMCDQKNEKDLATLPLFTSMVKHHVPETAKKIIDETITVFGGYGYFLEQDVERRYRDNRIVEMYEGTVEVQLNNMVRILKKLNMDFIDSSLL
ncbi:MAG: acyl-CoA dehydrogenase [Deltaproteobacteria bacterium HGW-Deltaproteobacteria-15]|jgi:alkylation response protein AidB-like acyl-CoA dehydrogenase|nr:MAG: acyl-CoA dehydrogenase [Deltaproteobacteria bacterium HGW-Deltaproteobacteria-15]